jgi:hypothetical protein
VVEAPTPAARAPHSTTPVPWTLLGLVLAAAAAVALRAGWAPRLEWGRG